LDNVNSGMGELTYGPLKVKEGKRNDPIMYYKEAYLGKIGQGMKIATIYFDQYGQYSNHELNKDFMTLAEQNARADIVEHTPQGIKEPLGQAGKNILITSAWDGKNTININMINHDDTYTTGKTGEKFIQEKDKNLAKDIDNNFYTIETFMKYIAEGRVNTFK